MHSKNAHTTLQCINCGLGLSRLKRRWMADETEELLKLLSDWTCKEPEDSDVVCNECYNLLHIVLESENKSRRFGHKITCLPCGRSLFRVRLSPLLAERPEHKLVIAQWTPSHQVKRLEHVCTKCWLKADRVVKKQNEAHSKSKEVSVKIEPLQSLLGDGELDIPASPDSQSEEENVPDKNPIPLSICMETYKRAADTSSRCIFKSCNQKDRLRPPKAILQRLLIDYSYYIPTKSRICKEHRINTHKVWRELVDESTITDFSVAHLENLCSTLKNIRCNSYCRNFVSVIKHDDYLCQYLLGVSYTNFEKMLKDIQPIRNKVWCLKKALTMYLMKKHTGFSLDKITKFFGLRLKMAVKIIHRVHAYLETLVASDDSYVAVPTVGCDKEEIVYYRV